MFVLYKEKIKYDKKAWIPPSLQEIINKESADMAVKWGLFVFLNADRTDDNPIKDIPETRRMAMARSIAFDDYDISKDKDNLNLSLNAINEYKEHCFDKTQADIDLYDKKMVEFMNLLKETDPKIVKNIHEQTGKVSYTTNIDIITTILENVIKIIIDKTTMVGLQKSGNSVVTLRGGLSPNSKGKLIKT